MSFLEMTKAYLSRQEKQRADLGLQRIDGHWVQKIIWETDRAIIFQDIHGQYYRYLHSYKQSWPVLIESNAGKFNSDNT